MPDEQELAALRRDVDELKRKFAALEEWLRDLGRRAAPPSQDPSREPSPTSTELARSPSGSLKFPVGEGEDPAEAEANWRRILGEEGIATDGG